MYLLTWISILDNRSAYMPSHICSITSEEDHKCWQMEAFLTDNKGIYISNNVEINKDNEVICPPNVPQYGVHRDFQDGWYGIQTTGNNINILCDMLSYSYVVLNITYRTFNIIIIITVCNLFLYFCSCIVVGVFDCVHLGEQSPYCRLVDSRTDGNHGMHTTEKFDMNMHTNIEVVKEVQDVMDEGGNTINFVGN